MSQTVAVSPLLLRRLWFAIGYAALFLVITTIQGMLREDYDAWHQAVSALSLGPRGWVQMVNLAAFGVVVTSTAPVWRRILADGTGAISYPALTALLGASFIAIAFLPQDPAPGYDPDGLALQAPTTVGMLHLGIAGVAALCSVACLFIMAARLAGDRHWLGWAAYTRVMALLIIVCVAVYGVWSTRASGLAGTFERLAIVIPLVWTGTFLRRLDAGTPFMVVPTGDAVAESSAAGIAR